MPMDNTFTKEPSRWYSVRRSFLLSLLCFIGIVVFCAWWYHLPMGTGPAGPRVPGEPFQRAWKNGKILFVGMGDSIITGFGSGGIQYSCFNRLHRTPIDDSEDMRDKDLSHVFPNLTVMNMATDASSSGFHLTQLSSFPRRDEDVFGIVILSTGGIDLIHDYGRNPPRDEAIYGATYEEGLEFGKKFRTRLEKLLDGIHDKFPGGCFIFLSNLYDPTDGVGDIENVHPMLKLVQKLPVWPDGLKIHGLWNRHIKEAAAKRDYVFLVDTHSVMLGHGIHCRDKDNPYYKADDPHYWYYFNLEDPNKRGYDTIRRVFLNAMIEAFGVRIDEDRTLE